MRLWSLGLVRALTALRWMHAPFLDQHAFVPLSYVQAFEMASQYSACLLHTKTSFGLDMQRAGQPAAFRPLT